MPDAAEPDNPQGATDTAQAARVFISYASQDKGVAEAVCRALEKAEVACWIAPRDVVPGESYAGAIVHAIDATKLIVLILSEHGVASQHVLREVERAASKRHPVVALRIDAAPMPPDLEYFLNTSQWLDASAQGVERSLPRLVDAVQRAIAPPSHVGVAQRPAASFAKRPPTSRPALRRAWLLVPALAVLVAAAYFAWDELLPTKHNAAEQPATASTNVIGDKSIAVLPFVDMSEKKDQEYFANGIAEEILGRLAKVPGLRVVGRASSFQFRDNSASPASIGTALGVTYLLEGSVRAEAGRVRVTGQLIEARTGAQRWSDRFDSNTVDVLQVQDSIATEIARALQITVEADTVPRPSVKSPQVLDAYLRGLQSFDRNTQTGCEAAVASFQQALSLDPKFAPAAIGLARTYAYLGSFGWGTVSVAFERAREAAELAKRLDPKSPIPHVELAEIYVFYDMDWDGAERELQQAFALGPRDSHGVEIASLLAGALAHWDEARQLGIEAVTLDPLSAEAHQNLGWVIYMRSDRLPEAEQSMRRALQIAPDFGAGHYFLGEILMLRGHYDEALAEFRKETADDGQFVGSAMLQFAAGHKAESDAQLAKAIRQNTGDWPEGIASIYAFRGEKDRAFEWLDRAYAARDHLYLFKGNPLMKNLEGDPRYKAFLRKMNLPE